MADSEKKTIQQLLPKIQSYLRTSVSCFDLKKPHIILSDSKPLEAFRALINWKIRVAPVFDKKSSEIIGLLDLRDAVKYVTTLQRESEENEAAVKEPSPVLKALKSFKFDILDHHPEFKKLTVSYLARSRRVPVLHLSKATLLDAAVLLHQGNHLVLVQKDSELVGFITQGMLFRLICDQLCDAMESLTVQDMADCNLVTPNPIVIKHSTPALEAFDLMGKKNSGCIGIIGDDGEILSSTSARDIKVWLKNLSGDYATMPIIDVMTIIRQEQASVKDKFPVASCRYDHTIATAFGRLKACQYHRLWVVDEDRMPIGIFSLTDIFRMVTGRIDEKPKN